jgi:hypothetical protein
MNTEHNAAARRIWSCMCVVVNLQLTRRNWPMCCSMPIYNTKTGTKGKKEFP